MQVDVDRRTAGIPEMSFFLSRGGFDPTTDPNTWAVVIEVHHADDDWRVIRYRAKAC